MHDEILIATTNAGKLREIVRILRGLPISLTTLADFPHASIPDETGATFAENARQKALHYADATGMVTMAEDSGFEVDALHGEPGIFSARYLRDDASYEERFSHIYEEVRRRGSANRAARFVCALAVADGSRVLFEVTRTVEGLLAERPAGTNGFGYDPIFLYPEYRRTFGEVSDDEKIAVSHRGRAIRALREYLVGSR